MPFRRHPLSLVGQRFRHVGHRRRRRHHTGQRH